MADEEEITEQPATEVATDNTQVSEPEQASAAPTNPYAGKTAKDIVTDSSQQMFDNFMNKNYTADQRQEIQTQIDEQISINGGNCTVEWQGDDKGDSVEITYQNGKMTRFELRNHTDGGMRGDEYIDLEADNSIKYKEKNSKVIVKTKEKTRMDGHTTTVKHKVKAHDDNRFDAKSSTSFSDQNVDIAELQTNRTWRKDSQHVSSEADGYKAKDTTTIADFNAGTKTNINIDGQSRTTHYDSDGNVTQTTTNNNHLSASLGGVAVQHQDSQQTYNNDGSSTYHENRAGVALNKSGVTVNAGITDKNYDENGEMSSSTGIDVMAGIGAGRVAGGVAYQRQTDTSDVKVRMQADFDAYQHCASAATEYYQQKTNENGTQEKGFTAHAAYGSKGVAAGYTANSRTTDADGNVATQDNSNAELAFGGSKVHTSYHHDHTDENGSKQSNLNMDIAKTNSSFNATLHTDHTEHDADGQQLVNKQSDTNIKAKSGELSATNTATNGDRTVNREAHADLSHTLPQAGISVTEQSKNGVKQKISLDTQKAYDIMENLAKENLGAVIPTVNSAEQVVTNAEQVAANAEQTVTTFSVAQQRMLANRLQR